MRIMIVVMILIYGLVGCDPKTNTTTSSKPKDFMAKKTPKKATEPKLNKLEIKVREEFDLLSKKEIILKPTSETTIKDATVMLYVESLPANDDGVLWKKGNDPRKKTINKEEMQVRAVCLGEEDGSYVFMTLRYFLDCTYPNYGIQGLQSPPQAQEEKDNFLQYTKMMRIIISHAHHTGGGQIGLSKIVPLVIENNLELTEVQSYDFMSSYSQIDGKNYANPVGEDVTAKDIIHMNQAMDDGQLAHIETFGNHDICLIRASTKHWDKPITHLNLKNPTQTIRLLTEKQTELYGFKFILLSENAYEAIASYKVPEQEVGGFSQLVIAATAIMSPQHVHQIRLLDQLLYRVFKKKNKINISLLTKPELMLLGIDFSRHFLDIRLRDLQKFIKLGK